MFTFDVFHVFVTSGNAFITMGKGLFHMFEINRNVETTNGTYRIVIMPKASGTLYHHNPDIR